MFSWMGGSSARKRALPMTFSIARLLLHSNSVSQEVRDALKSAFDAAPEHRNAGLEQASQLLYAGTDLECSDARELVGLSPCGSCA